MHELSSSHAISGDPRRRRAELIFRSLAGSAAAALLALSGVVAAGGAAAALGSGADGVRTLASTVPSNGDLNPYGVAVVPRSIGDLVTGDVLVSNFNNSTNHQGTGSTIVEIAPSGHVRVFATISSTEVPTLGGVGLTTALAILSSGWVIVGDLPTANGSATTAGSGGLIVLNPTGRVVETITGSPINGPWDLASLTDGTSAVLFVSNVLNTTVAAGGAVVDKGTVVRISLTAPAPASGEPDVTTETIIGTGFPEQTTTTALVVGPTGLGLAPNGSLYVADSLESRIAAIPDAVSRTGSDGTGNTVAQGAPLDDPLGLTVMPGEIVLAVNGGNGNLVEVTATGAEVTRTLDTNGTPPGAGALFGLAPAPGKTRIYFVDDATNTLDVGRLVGR